MLPKPQHCGQDWLAMQPAAGGRICGKCDKLIVDFSRMRWAEIEALQRQHHNSLCGMYSRRQLESWGTEPLPNACSKLTATVALMASLTTAPPGFGQVTDKSQQRKITPLTPVAVELQHTNLNKVPDTTQTVLQGIITGKSQQGRIDTLSHVEVRLQHTTLRTISDERGRYKLDLSEYIDSIANPRVEFTAPDSGFNTVVLASIRKGVLTFNPQLTPLDPEFEKFIRNRDVTTYYAIRKPTLGQRLWRVITLPFRLLASPFRSRTRD